MDIHILLLEAAEIQISMEIVVHIFGTQGMIYILFQKRIACCYKISVCSKIRLNQLIGSSFFADLDG